MSYSTADYIPVFYHKKHRKEKTPCLSVKLYLNKSWWCLHCKRTS